MSELKTFFELDQKSLFIAFILFLAVFKYGFDLIVSVCQKLGIEFKSVRKKREHEELLLNTVEQNKAIKEDLIQVSNTISLIKLKLDSMQEESNKTEMAKLKDTLINYYTKYTKINHWTALEKEAFWDLFERYEARGGNGFIHTIVEPEMRRLEEIEIRTIDLEEVKIHG